MASYIAADSPRENEAEQYNRNIQDVSRDLQEFHQITRSIQQKMALFNTPQDSRLNHQQLKELTEKGNKLVTRINSRLQSLTKACQGPQARSRKTQVNKLSSDYKNQLRAFEETCQKLVDSEQGAVANIRKTSSSFRHDGRPLPLDNYSEDQIYAQATVQNYDEDDLARREEDIVQINQQLREVNAAFREVDDMIAAQGEVVVEIEENADAAKANVEGALENVRQADAKKGFCVCSRTKMMCWGLLLLIVVVIVVALVVGLKK